MPLEKAGHDTLLKLALERVEFFEYSTSSFEITATK